MSFTQLGLRAELIEAVVSKGYAQPTPIQSQAIPAILEGRDLMGGSQTGTGKTAAFTLPMLQLLAAPRSGAQGGGKRTRPRALVLTPTRELAAQVGEKFLERFQGHQHAPRMSFRVGQCYYKSKQYAKASQSFDRFGKVFPDDALTSDALFWSGEAFRLAANNLEAFNRYNRCRTEHPASEAAKYARGRLALPEMLQQFEAAANSLDQDQ